jgi:Uma2 family endonuclease
MYYQACPSVQEYVLVHTHYQWVEVFRREQNNLWTYHAFEDGDEVTFTSLDVHFSISKLYRNVDLPVDTDEQET